ncbi:MAG TPA: GntR family transcriptional regulator [Bryobacteraceae bacterium]|jgi:GntR family transcriptional regulator|nr:GntR family transcriptional regulator [Bryobacteraceae bacterium]
MKTAPALKIDLASPESAYEQIATGLRTLLVAGEFRPGAQLPTVRQLAMDLGVHHNTVAEAYRILAQEGWLDLKRRRGATVLERPRPEATPEARAKFVRRLQELAARATAEGVPAAAIVRELGDLTRKLRTRGIK